MYYIINIINFVTCFGSLNHPQTNSYKKVKVDSASAHTMGSHNSMELKFHPDHDSHQKPA